MNSEFSESTVQNKEINGSVNKIWYCKQCGMLEKVEADFAKHLRSHFKGHRARATRRAAKSFSNGITGSLSSNGISISQNPTSLLKFDNISTRQLEITQPNIATNLMTINGDDVCERLVDPALVMPTKNYQEPIGFNRTLDTFSRNTEKNDTFLKSSEKNQNGDDFSLNEVSAAAAKELSEKEITLQILDDILIESSTDFKSVDLTKPLQLFYVSADNSLNIVPDKTQDVGHNGIITKNSVNDIFEMNPDDAFDINLNSDYVSDDNVNGVSSKDDETSLICEICQKNFKTSAYLYRHLRKHTGEFKCGTCSTTFARKETWITHRCIGKNIDKDSAKSTDFTQSETPTPIVVGNRDSSLSALVPTKNATDDAVKVAHNTSKTTSDAKRRAMECPTCGVTLSDASCLKRHMLTHDRAPCYTCVYCMAVVQHRHSIRRHLRLHHPEYEHEWNNRAFITSLQTEDTERRFSTSTHKRIANTKKKKIHMATKNSDANFKIPLKKDSVLGMATDLDYKVLQPVNSSFKCSGSGSVSKESSIDLSDQISSGFTVHFEDDISFPGLSDSLGKTFDSDKNKFDLKDNSPIKIFTRSFMTNSFNTVTDSSCDSIKSPDKTFVPFSNNGFKTADIAPSDTFRTSFASDSFNVDKPSENAVDRTSLIPSFLKNGLKKHDIVNSEKTDSTLSTNNCRDFSVILNEISDTGLGCNAVFKNCDGTSLVKDIGCVESGGKIMPSMPVIFCNDDEMVTSEDNEDLRKEVEILVEQSTGECLMESVPALDYTTSVVLSEEPSSTGYNLLEESSSMHLIETSNDFTFFVLVSSSATTMRSAETTWFVLQTGTFDDKAILKIVPRYDKYLNNDGNSVEKLFKVYT